MLGNGMFRKRAPAATAIAALVSGLALAPAPASAWSLFGSKPQTSAPPKAPPTPSTAPATKGASAEQKATPAQRAAADRLDPLSRSAFWAREVDKDPTDIAAALELATSLRQLGRYEEAVQQTSRALVLDPKNLAALLEEARNFIGANKGFYAIDPLRRAEAIAPRDWRAYSLMGVAREQNQQPDEARAAYGQALALSPNNPAVLSNLALWYVAHGDPLQGEALLRQAVAEPDSTAQERQNLALVLGLKGKYADAERLMREDLPPEIAESNLNYVKAVSAER